MRGLEAQDVKGVLGGSVAEQGTAPVSGLQAAECEIHVLASTRNDLRLWVLFLKVPVAIPVAEERQTHI